MGMLKPLSVQGGVTVQRNTHMPTPLPAALSNQRNEEVLPPINHPAESH